MAGTYFYSGDEACAEGAIAAGCRFFAGYPITPATEIAEHLSERMPEIGGTYIQMEDEIASMAAVLGAAWGGKKAMTATSGPGFSLMMENIGLGAMLETPCVVVDIQRAGPSTGLPTMNGQGDMMQARWGSHGVYSIIALSPSSPQELFDLTIRAFNLSEKYRVPVLIMGDEAIGHMYEKVTVPPLEKLQLITRKKPDAASENVQPYAVTEDMIPPMPETGAGHRFHVTGLTHDERGYPVMTAAAQDKLVSRLINKIELNRRHIVQFEEQDIKGAEVVVCSYGISARVASIAIEQARAEGIKVGFFRLITVWPFPEEKIREIAGKIKAFVVPEVNNGQISLEVERASAGYAKTILVPHLGGGVHDPAVILEAIRQAAK
ncbi:MAG TPA: 2-oxoacid:acceptor oxidoreductase subunit alpha [Dehalococcoidales bacterium]|nr:2-oxoacid:acceptor oxidoreductase subunit alpha [Dehalococcoidales bacterium]